MRHLTRLTAALQLLLIFPAAFFMTALLLRYLRPLPYEPAHTAQRIVMWYAGHMWTLWVLLLALPLAALVLGCATLFGPWNRGVGLGSAARHALAKVRAYPAAFLVAATTLTAAGILVIVVLHMLAN